MKIYVTETGQWTTERPDDHSGVVGWLNTPTHPIMPELCEAAHESATCQLCGTQKVVTDVTS